jgi:hypothetical protein
LPALNIEQTSNQCCNVVIESFISLFILVFRGRVKYS